MAAVVGFAECRDRQCFNCHTRVMGGSLIEARKRLPSPADLKQAAELLNVPGLDAADLNPDAPLHRQQAAILARIADWASLSAKAAAEIGDLDFAATQPYAYLIERLDEYDTGWWQADGESGSGIEESPDSPETYAQAVMNRYLDYMRDHLEDYEEDINQSELHIRVSVWPVRSVTDAHPSTAPDPDHCPPGGYGRALKHARISPHAVELRTPLQIHHYVNGGGITV